MNLNPSNRNMYTNFREKWRREYASFDAMPERTRVGVATLSMCADGEKIEGVGQRVTPNTFWLDDTKHILEEYNDVP